MSPCRYQLFRQDQALSLLMSLVQTHIMMSKQQSYSRKCLTDYLCLSLQVSAVQTGPSSFSIDVFGTDTHHDVKTDIHIKGIYTTKVSYSANLLIAFHTKWLIKLC